jgi:serine/threonine protein kinase
MTDQPDKPGSKPVLPATPLFGARPQVNLSGDLGAGGEEVQPLFKKRAQMDKRPVLMVPVKRIGTPKIPGYRIERTMGADPFGRLFEAAPESGGRNVVIKAFDRLVDDAPQTLRRKAERLRRVSRHPRLVPLLELDLAAEWPYWIIPMYPAALTEVVSSGRPMADINRVAKWFEEMAIGLHALHSKGVFHGLLHPGNVVAAPSLEVFIADYGQHGIAGDPTHCLSEPLYMPAEQAVVAAAGVEPTEPEAAWDIYAMGAVVYALLTGAPPYADAGPPEWLARRDVLMQHLDEYRNMLSWNRATPVRQKNENVDAALATMVETCIAPLPEERYGSAAQVVVDLRARASARPISMFHLPPGATTI